MKIKFLCSDKTLQYAASELKSFMETMTESSCAVVDDGADVVLGLLPEDSVKNALTDDRYVIDIKDGFTAKPCLKVLRAIRKSRANMRLCLKLTPKPTKNTICPNLTYFCSHVRWT